MVASTASSKLDPLQLRYTDGIDRSVSDIILVTTRINLTYLVLILFQSISGGSNDEDWTCDPSQFACSLDPGHHRHLADMGETA